MHPYDPAALPTGSLLLLWFLLNLLLPHFQTFPAMPRLRFSRTEDPTPRGMHTQTAVCAGAAAAAVGPGPSAWLGSGHTRLTAPSGAHFSVNQKRRHRCGSGPPSQARPFSTRGWWRVWDGGAPEALAGGRAQDAGYTETGIHSPMCVWAMTSASRWAAPLPPLWVDEDEVVEVVEPWMAWLIQCSMLMLPWLEVGVPWESPCTEPSSSEPEEVSARQVTGEGLWRSWWEQPRLPRRPAPSPGARTRQRSSLQCRNDPPKTPQVNRHGKVFDITVSGYGTRAHFLHQQFGRNHVCSLAHMPSVAAEGSMCSRC